MTAPDRAENQQCTASPHRDAADSWSAGPRSPFYSNFNDPIPNGHFRLVTFRDASAFHLYSTSLRHPCDMTPKFGRSPHAHRCRLTQQDSRRNWLNLIVVLSLSIALADLDRGVAMKRGDLHRVCVYARAKLSAARTGDCRTNGGNVVALKRAALHV